MTAGVLALIDTNVLLTATDDTRAGHGAARSLLSTDARDLAITPQVIREYLSVSTRPVEVNGLGASPDLALTNVEILTGSLRLPPEHIDTTARLLDLVRRLEVRGRQVHDANIVAVAQAHGASTIITSDVRHFSRFADLIEIEGLS